MSYSWQWYRECSPRPRGWSRHTAEEVRERQVLPAPAGMVPWARPSSGRSRSAPRARGDGPLITSRGREATQCSPRPRGWSQGVEQRRDEADVLPAPAGMVPGPAGPRPEVGSAPRARGDGPATSSTAPMLSRCSPRPRGWSRAVTPITANDVVLPAPAGMVPREEPVMAFRFRAPRARGDGPPVISPMRTASWCSPRPRGWSRQRPPVPRPGGVLPAPAGMVPPRTPRGPTREGAPRARGDGPWRPAAVPMTSMCSPRPRGWSPGERRKPQGGQVLPAPAGMVP